VLVIVINVEQRHGYGCAGDSDDQVIGCLDAQATQEDLDRCGARPRVERPRYVVADQFVRQLPGSAIERPADRNSAPRHAEAATVLNE
jgi:hypothetical protein